MNQQEEWRPVDDWPDYQVSSLGRIASLKRKRPCVLAGFRNQNGYRLVTLSGAGRKEMARTIHRLVAAAFLGEPPTGMQCRHLDGDKENNAASNLAYGTASENMLDQVAHGVHNMARKTHCKRGHEFTPENTRTYQNKRICRTCKRQADVDSKTRRAFHAAGIGVAA